MEDWGGIWPNISSSPPLHLPSYHLHCSRDRSWFLEFLWASSHCIRCKHKDANDKISSVYTYVPICIHQQTTLTQRRAKVSFVDRFVSNLDKNQYLHDNVPILSNNLKYFPIFLLTRNYSVITAAAANWGPMLGTRITCTAFPIQIRVGQLVIN